jgi:hypothetical protein
MHQMENSYPTASVVELRLAAAKLQEVRALMLAHGLLQERFSYDNQIAGLISRCNKAADKLVLAQLG